VTVRPTPTPAPVEPTWAPAPTTEEGGRLLPDRLKARDAVLAYLGETYGEQAPPTGLTWKEEQITLEGLAGWEGYRYTSGDWVSVVAYPVVAPEATTYRMSVENPASGFWWEGRVDAQSQVAEGPDAVLTARDAALSYIAAHYAGKGPGTDPSWRGGRVTPQGLVGTETYEYTSGDWTVTVSYPVVAPEQIVYHIVVSNSATGFRWEGEMDARLVLKQTAASEEPSFQVRDAETAIDMALGHANRRYGMQFKIPPLGLTWIGDQPAGQGAAGSEAVEFTSVGAPGWVAIVSHPAADSGQTVYQVILIGQAAGFRWVGTVDAAGEVTELAVAIEK
jgi:hypothetical protein